MQTTLKGKTVAVGDAQLSVYDAGSGPSLVFLHGNASRWQHWEPQLRALADRFRCVAFDQIGYGGSSTLARTNSMSLMADTTAALCRELGIDHAYVVGLSMGGAVAQALALRHPALVDGLVLAGPTRLDAAPAPGAMPTLSVEILRPLLTAAFGPTIQQQQPALVARMVEECLETNLDTISNISIEDWPAIDAKRITAPALVLAGELDGTAPADGRLLASNIPGAAFREFAGVGHMLNIEAAEDFTATIVEFVKQHPPRR